jgi:hypothetical protein
VSRKLANASETANSAVLPAEDARLDLGIQSRVLGHHRLRFEHLAGDAAGLRPALLELAATT